MFLVFTSFMHTVVVLIHIHNDLRKMKLRRSVRVKYLLDFQFPLLDRYSYSIFHFRVFSRYFMLNLIFVLSFN